jgi:hypothetical protein
VRFSRALMRRQPRSARWAAYRAGVLAGVLALLGGTAFGALTSGASAAVMVPAQTATSLTFTASPNPATLAATVTLRVTISPAAAGGGGKVQFEVGGSDIGAAVGVTSVGIAQTTTAFTSTGLYALSAVFTPGSSSYSGSTATLNELVTGPYFNGEPVTVTNPPGGSFALTVAAGTVTLTQSGSTATAALNPITVSDTRNTYPGWSVSGQASNFTGTGTGNSGQTIAGNQLGWTPTDTSLGHGVTLGTTVAPASPGLGTTAAILASATAPNGFGTSVLGANLTLAIPASAYAGPYAGTLTVTAVTSLA